MAVSEHKSEDVGANLRGKNTEEGRLALEMLRIEEVGSWRKTQGAPLLASRLGRRWSTGKIWVVIAVLELLGDPESGAQESILKNTHSRN